MKERSKLRVGIVGFLPPPYGGITIHISRLRLYLKSRGIQVRIIDEYKGINRFREKFIEYGGFINYLKSLRVNHIYHYHSPNRFVRFLFGLLSLFGFKTVLTLHGEGIVDQIEKHGRLWRFFYTLFLSKINMIICDNAKIYQYMIHQGFSEERLKIIPAFIPPTQNPEYFNSIPDYIKCFYKKHKITVFAMGWVKFYKNFDLYGLDMIIELVARLNKYYSRDVGFILKIMISDVSDVEYLNRLLEEGNKYKDNLLIIQEDLEEIYPLEQMASVVVRPSITDGDSVSIQESLFLGTPVITSDAIPRPKGCMLFKNRDMEDFEKKVRELINKLLKGETINVFSSMNAGQEILSVYNKIVNVS